jgi:HNH endonuclease/AP2 domain
MLTQKRLKELLHYNRRTGKFIWLKKRSGQRQPGTEAGCKGHKGGIVIRIDRKAYLASRLAYLYVKGIWPDGEMDHENRDVYDTRWTNLRLATHAQNACNSKVRSHNRTGFKGVSIKGNRFFSRIKTKKKTIYLGHFATAEEAHIAYVKAAKIHHGQFARAK